MVCGDTNHGGEGREYPLKRKSFYTCSRMLKFFKKKPKEKLPPQLLDIDGVPIQEGDEVMAQRYELGKSKVELEGLQFFYVSIATGKRVSYVKMIDAITGNQKVRKVGN